MASLERNKVQKIMEGLLKKHRGNRADALKEFKRLVRADESLLKDCIAIAVDDILLEEGKLPH
jgi:hypothetical protein